MSEFGKGYSYCIGLFLAHAERVREHKEYEKKSGSTDIWPGMWFNGAADHLYDLQIPTSLPKAEQREISTWRDKCIEHRMGKPKWQDVDDAIQKAKDLLRAWDTHNNIPTEKGDWE